MTTIVGLAGSAILVLGAAWPDRAVLHPRESLKNWLFAVGALCMLFSSILNYQAGAPIFFIFLELLVTFSSVLMMLNVPERIDTPLVLLASLAMIVWSFLLFHDLGTVFFVIELSGIAVGSILKTGTARREIALILGSALIALFSYLTATWIFFWLNVFFALFSGYYAWKDEVRVLSRRTKRMR
ncbi:hypothetical protein HY285_00175 [Candidatus Peregrinibacteria bacterium]|nr:hypothetical protein [Candidatus Peregrinibacteria bacterium]MBI3815951.1 hypothetical protein [Candidatus Peregrinibacteria bacterium]